MADPQTFGIKVNFKLRKDSAGPYWVIEADKNLAQVRFINSLIKVGILDILPPFLDGDQFIVEFI